jgi:hypothetical protein
MQFLGRPLRQRGRPALIRSPAVLTSVYWGTTCRVRAHRAACSRACHADITRRRANSRRHRPEPGGTGGEPRPGECSVAVTRVLMTARLPL